jgi:hypothetical protein
MAAISGPPEWDVDPDEVPLGDGDDDPPHAETAAATNTSERAVADRLLRSQIASKTNLSAAKRLLRDAGLIALLSSLADASDESTDRQKATN